MSRLTMSALCVSLFASSFARAQPIEQLRRDYERMRTTYEDHCRAFVENGVAGSPSHEKIADNLLGRLNGPINEIDGRIDYQLRFLTDPEGAATRYANSLRNKHLDEITTLEQMRSDGRDFGSIESQRMRVRDARLKWESIHGTRGDRSAFESFTDREVAIANARLVELRELRQGFESLQRDARSCERLAASGVRWAADPDPPPPKPLPPAIAAGTAGWNPWAGTSSGAGSAQ